MTGQFMYTHIAKTRYPTWVDIENGSERVSGLTVNWTAIYEISKDKVTHAYNSSKTSWSKSRNVPVTILENFHDLDEPQENIACLGLFATYTRRVALFT